MYIQSIVHKKHEYISHHNTLYKDQYIHVHVITKYRLVELLKKASVLNTSTVQQ